MVYGGLPAFHCFNHLSAQILPMICGRLRWFVVVWDGLRWFVVVCGRLRWFAMVCLMVIPYAAKCIFCKSSDTVSTQT